MAEFVLLPLARSMELADCYRLLGLRTGASYEDIKASYRRLARRYHPDANLGNQQYAKEKFIQLTEAYRSLMSVVPPPKAIDAKASPTVDFKQAREREAEAAKSTPQSAKPSTRSTAKASATPSTQPLSPPSAQPPTQPKRQPPPLQTNHLSAIDRQLKQNSYEQLQQLLREQRFARSIALVEGLAQRFPNDMEIRQWQAITYQRFGRHLVNTNQPDKAKVYLQKALRTDPHNKSLWYEVDRDMRRLEQPEIV